MSGPASLHLLHLEDDPRDRELVMTVLRQHGLSCVIRAVATRDEFESALASESFDVILADDRLPAFDGLTAQQIAAARAPHVPLIFVTGSLGEEVAVERLKSGAVDYVLKQRLARLPPAITRAISEARTRLEHARAEVEVRRLNAELEQRVLERTAQLEAANQALADRERALSQSEARLNAVLEHSPAIISLTDVDGRYLFVNQQFERSFELVRAEVVGRTVRELFPAGFAEIYQAHDAEALARREPIAWEEPVMRRGELHVYSASRFPLLGADGLPYALCSILTDITHRKIAEDEIKGARLEAERANRAKSEFLSRMSHDLRTPLNSVLGFAQLLAAEPLSEDQMDCVRQVLHGGSHLLNLINEVLDISRIESGHLSLSPEPVEVRETVLHATTLVGPLARQRQILVSVEDSPLADLAVVADRQRLSQILLNLLSNAVKYNRDAGSVTVSLERVGDQALRINVTDTGTGIPPQKLRLLFRPFERLGAESTAIEGTGLGLTLSRGLAEAMGGRVGVVSQVGVGSTFWVELQLAADGAVGATISVAEEPVEYRSGRAATVLYIEDNMSNVRLMERLMSRRPSLTLTTARDGQGGLARARAQPPDIVLLDLHLPDLPGEEVLRRLKDDPASHDIPVIVLSADATPGQVRRLLASGASAYLTKPLAIPQVLATIDRVLHERIPADHPIQEPDSRA